MKKVALFVAAFALFPLASAAEVSALTSARKACDELNSEIAAKLDAKGVKNYTLTLVKVGEVKSEDKVVGSCDSGTMKIVYVRK